MTEQYLETITNECHSAAKEEYIKVYTLGEWIFATGSELACLRIEHKFIEQHCKTYNVKIHTNFNQIEQTWYIKIEPIN